MSLQFGKFGRSDFAKGRCDDGCVNVRLAILRMRTLGHKRGIAGYRRRPMRAALERRAAVEGSREIDWCSISIEKEQIMKTELVYLIWVRDRKAQGRVVLQVR